MAREQRMRTPGRTRLRWRLVVVVAATAAVAALLAGPAERAGAVENGVGIIKITNTANGTWASVDSNGFPAPAAG